VHQNRGCLAIRRGPIVYALESVDQDPSAADLRLVRIDGSAALEAADMNVLDKRVVSIRTRGAVVDVPVEDKATYTPEGNAKEHGEKPVNLIFVPYFAWANRGPSDMRVWIQASVNHN
jgi:DUF1680 family protein